MWRAGTLFAVVVCWMFLLTSVGLPAWAQESTAADDQYSSGDEGCASPQPVQTFNGTENQRTSPFNITGETFRLRFETEPAGPDPFVPTVDIEVLDENGRPIGQGPIIFDGEDGSENILAGPGTFSLQIEAEDASYSITVEDCTGSTSPTNPTNPTNPTTQGPVSNPKGLVPGTVSSKPLPNTGGSPLIVGALVLLGTALVVGRNALRR